MATQTTTPKADGKITEIFDVDAAATRWNAAATDYLDFYEKSVGQLADAEVKAAQTVKLPVVSTLIETHADLSRQLAGAYVSAAREMLKS